MRKKIVFQTAISILLVLLLNSCSAGSFFSDLFKKITQVVGDPVANNQAIMVDVLEAIQKKDKSALIKLFSKNTVSRVEYFNQSMSDLFDYYQGNYLSLEWKGSTGHQSWDYGEKTEEESFSFDVKTSVNEYRFCIKYCAVDTTDEDNIGICSLYIIKMEDDTDSEHAYGGDGKDTPGINIGIKNILPAEIDEQNQS